MNQIGFIFHLEIATKQDIRARPSKIVAGLEAEKTNEFLIAIARAIDRKIDTTEAVTLVKSGNVSDTQKKEPKTTAAAGGKKTPMKGGKEMNELKKAKSFNKKSTKRSDGSEKVVAGADKQSVKHLNDAKKSKPKSFAQIREQNDGDKKTESDKDSTPKTDEPEMKTELQPKVVNVNKNTNGNAMVSVNEFYLNFDCKNRGRNNTILTNTNRVILLMIRKLSQTLKWSK